MKRLLLTVMLPALAGVAQAQKVTDRAEIVPQVEWGGAVLVAPLDVWHPTQARPLALQKPELGLGEFYQNSFTTTGALEWRDGTGKRLLKMVRLASFAAFENGEIRAAFVALSPDGRLIASQGVQNTLFWQNTWSGEVVRRLPHLKKPFGFSSQSHKFVAASGKQKLSVFQVDGPGQRELQCDGTPHLFQWSPDETRLLVSSDAPRKPSLLQAFDTSSGKPLFSVALFPQEQNLGFRWTTDGGLVTASLANSIGFKTPRLFWVRRFNGQGQLTQSNHVELTRGVANPIFKFQGNDVLLQAKVDQFNPDGSSIAATRFFHLGVRQEPLSIEEKEWRDASASPQGFGFSEYFSPGCAPNPAPSAEIATALPLRFLGQRGANILAADGSHLWDARTGQLIRAFQPKPDQATALDVSPDQSLFTSAGAGGYGNSFGPFAGVWNTRTGKLKWKRTTEMNLANGNDFTQGGPLWTTASKFSPDAKTLANASSSFWLDIPPLQLQDARSGRILWHWKGYRASNPSTEKPVVALDWSPGGQTLAVSQAWFNANETGQPVYTRLELVNARNGQVRHRLTSPPVNSQLFGALRFSPDGRTLAVASSAQQTQQEEDGPRLVTTRVVVELRDGRTGNLQRQIGKEQGELGTNAHIEFFAWSPDGQHLAAASQNRGIFVWNTRTGVLEARFDAHFQTPRALCWLGPNRLASTGDDGMLFVWNTRTQHLAATQLWLRPKDGSSIEWLAWTPDGFFDTSRGALPFVRFRAGSRLLAPGALFKERFNPAKVRAALLGSQR
jgi:WD40 repeat protein